MLADPYGVIVGEYFGHLYVAEDENNDIIGVCGLTKVQLIFLCFICIYSHLLLQGESGSYEMVKLGVLDKAQGKGVGKKLVVHCLDKAKELKASKVELESHTSLQAALKMYESLGFRTVEGQCHFVTANVKMELSLT